MAPVLPEQAGQHSVHLGTAASPRPYRRIDTGPRRPPRCQPYQHRRRGTRHRQRRFPAGINQGAALHSPGPTGIARRTPALAGGHRPRSRRRSVLRAPVGLPRPSPDRDPQPSGPSGGRCSPTVGTVRSTDRRLVPPFVSPRRGTYRTDRSAPRCRPGLPGQLVVTVGWGEWAPSHETRASEDIGRAKR